APLPPRARMRASIAVAAGSFVIGGLLVWQLPYAHAAMERRIARWLGAMDDEEITGVASNMRLGTSHGMLLSDRVVMRSDVDADDLAPHLPMRARACRARAADGREPRHRRPSRVGDHSHRREVDRRRTHRSREARGHRTRAQSLPLLARRPPQRTDRSGRRF